MIIQRMCKALALPIEFVEGLSRGASYEYRELKVARRNGAGYRLVYHPSRRLKGLQRWLLRNVIEPLPLHDAAMAYRTGMSIWDNANQHASSNYLLRLDFERFFESITVGDIELYIADRSRYFEGWTLADIDVFCRLVCRNGALTIGAPTSPAISNAICYELDNLVERLCRKEDVTYTRYADDLFFSTRRRDFLKTLETEIPGICKILKWPSNLRLNLAKTRHSSKKRVRRVTGITLGSDELPHIGRAVKRRIRAQVHQLDSLDGTQRASLAGLLAYVLGHDPGFVNTLIKKYGLSHLRRAQGG